MIESNKELINSRTTSILNPEEVLFFWGHTGKPGEINQSCLSQWYPSSFQIDKIIYPTAEHYMMSAKARLFNDQDSLDKILQTNSPAEAKKIGRSINNFNPLKWDEIKFDTVVSGNVAKFYQNLFLRNYLLSTKDKILVEASPVDNIWGIGLAKTNPDALDIQKWKGSNLLGYALMKARNKIKTFLKEIESQ